MQLPGSILPKPPRAAAFRCAADARALRAERLLAPSCRIKLIRAAIWWCAEVIAIDIADAALANAIKARFSVLHEGSWNSV